MSIGAKGQRQREREITKTDIIVHLMGPLGQQIYDSTKIELAKVQRQICIVGAGVV